MIDDNDIIVLNEEEVLEKFVLLLAKMNKDKNDFPKQEGDIAFFEVKFALSRESNNIISISPILVSISNIEKEKSTEEFNHTVN